MPTRNQQQLEKALRQAAQIVADHGDKYLPLFERLERELVKAKHHQSARNRALKLAHRKIEDASENEKEDRHTQ